jgi:hypothetical protein
MARLQDSLWDAARQVLSIWVFNGREITETKNIFNTEKIILLKQHIILRRYNY